MANGIFNVSKGDIKTAGQLGAANDAIVIALILTAGLEADATLVDHDDFTALFGAANDEATGGAYVRKSVTTATVTVDDTNDRLDVDIADQTWTALDCGDVSKLLTGYDTDTTAGTDANIRCVSHHDFVIQPDGSDVTAGIALLWRAA